MTDRESRWDNAWNTAADHQIPAESFSAIRTHEEHVTTTYGEFFSDSSDLSSSSDFGSFD